MAEYYRIYDLDALPVAVLAVLASGLPPYSRSKQKYTGQKIPDTTALLALIHDDLAHLSWMWSKDGEKGRNHPASVFQLLMSGETDKDIESFLTAEDFETARNKILREGGFIT